MPYEEFVPKSTKELYEKMCNTKQLCGKIRFENKTIFRDLYDGINIEISIEPPATYYGIDRKLFWNIADSVTHWHPECEDIYREILDIGTKGNVLVIQKSIFCVSVLYGKGRKLSVFTKNKMAFRKDILFESNDNPHIVKYIVSIIAFIT